MNQFIPKTILSMTFKKYLLLKEKSEIDFDAIERNKLFNSYALKRGDVFDIGPVYHGGGWNGKSSPLVRDGVFGTGVYFTDNYERAKSYATDKEWHEIQGAKSFKNKYIIEAMLSLKNPLILETEGGHLPYPAKALEMLGVEREKAADKIDKQFERTGNVGSVIRKLGQSKGYDGMIVDFYNNEKEYIVWNPFASVLVIKSEKV